MRLQSIYIQKQLLIWIIKYKFSFVSFFIEFTSPQIIRQRCIHLIQQSYALQIRKIITAYNQIFMSRRILAVLPLLAAASLMIDNIQPSNEDDTLFKNFKDTHRKTYSNAEAQNYRKTIFRKNLAKIEAHNADKTQTYTIGITKFSDLNEEQFVKIYLKTKVNIKLPDNILSRAIDAASDFPIIIDGVDWVVQGKVSPIKNQGNCGACWAFAANAAIESAYLLRGITIDLSQQQLIDCSKDYKNQGCNGGWMNGAYQYSIDRGIKKTSQYLYKGVNQACVKDGGLNKIKGFVTVPKRCQNVENALSARPISLVVDATIWSQYKTGVISNCGSAVNHGGLLVGSNNDYWTIKNSWGTSWGESGYIRLAKGDTCGVCSYASYPTL